MLFQNLKKEIKVLGAVAILAIAAITLFLLYKQNTSVQQTKPQVIERRAGTPEEALQLQKLIDSTRVKEMTEARKQAAQEVKLRNQ